MYNFFYDVAVYANTNWAKGAFTPKEVAENAYFYTCDCQSSTSTEPYGSMQTLLSNLIEDADNGNEEADRLLGELIDWLER